MFYRGRKKQNGLNGSEVTAKFQFKYTISLETMKSNRMYHPVYSVEQSGTRLNVSG